MVDRSHADAALHLALLAEEHVATGNPSLALDAVIGGLLALAKAPAPPASLPRVPAEPDQTFRQAAPRPRRATVRMLYNLHPRPCTACGPDVSPHDATLWLQWGEGSATQGRATCERNALALQLSALAGQVTP